MRMPMPPLNWAEQEGLCALDVTCDEAVRAVAKAYRIRTSVPRTAAYAFCYLQKAKRMCAILSIQE